MDVVGSEIGQKMRSAIKAKLTELGCYVDDELPDYVMVMVANKRTRAQMEDDLQLFLGDNTELFVNWLHQVLKKLQEVTVAPIKVAEAEKVKDSSTSKEKKSKEHKHKDKDKSKKAESSKKSKKKDKEKIHKKKEAKIKKPHKSKKKSKKHEMIRPNVPPLLMNIEKESEPSITDVFAGQILKNHGIMLDTPKVDPKVDEKPSVPELKRPMLPIIDPATITTQPEPSQSSMESITTINDPEVEEVPISSTVPAPRDEQIKEMNEIEAKIQGLKQKLAEQLDSMSDDEDFLTIRTEAEELMNDFADDVYQEISQAAPPAPAATPPPAPPATCPSPSPKPKEPAKEPETLPQIELKLPKRPVRERLGTREEKPVEKEAESPERFTPEREPEPKTKKSVRSRLDEPEKRKSSDDDKSDTGAKRVSSKVSVLERPRVTCASVVRVRPRPRVGAPSNSLLLRAVADAHKSLLNIPPKVEAEPAKIKRALVKPMRRCVDPQKIVIQVKADRDENAEKSDSEKQKSSFEKEDFTPALLTKKIVNTDFLSSRNKEPRSSGMRDDIIIETLNIHNPTVDKQKDTQFIVTMDGYDPNVFLTKKLQTEGLLDDDVKDKNTETVLKTKETSKKDDVVQETETIMNKEVVKEKKESNKETKSESKEAKHDKKDSKDDKVTTNTVQKKRLSDTSEESDTQVIINQETEDEKTEMEQEKMELSPTSRKRKKSPIVFDVEKREKKDKTRERTESVGSDNHVTVTTTTSTHKYDSVPSLSAAERALLPCRAFPLCRYGAACAFLHPRCRFAAACTRRHCVYAHPPAHAHKQPPLVASHVVPVATFKSIQPSAVPSICKFYPNCVNPVCHFAHPKPCRYGKACLNRAECNFYHADSNKWRYPV